MAWLHQQVLKPRLELIPNKLRDRQLIPTHFLDLFNQREKLLTGDSRVALEFTQEMNRFLPSEQVNKQGDLWPFIVYLISDLGAQLRRCLAI